VVRLKLQPVKFESTSPDFFWLRELIVIFKGRDRLSNKGDLKVEKNIKINLIPIRHFDRVKF